ncbi:unnamed protein product, partial [Closterium sp. Naga37s-1]
IGVTSGALIFVAEDFDLSHVQQEIFVGILNIVSLVGALSAGRLADFAGRRFAMGAAASIFIAGALCMAFAPTYAVLVTGRVVTGVGVGFGLALPPLFISEISPPGQRGGLVSFGELFINIGIVVGFLTSFLLSGLPVDSAWRWMLGLGAVPGFILAVGVVFLPESPRWLIMHGQVKKAKDILLTISDSKQEAHERMLEILEAAGLKEEVISKGPAAGSEFSPARGRSNSRDRLEGSGGEGGEGTVYVDEEEQEIHVIRAMEGAGGKGVWKELLWPTPAVGRMLVVCVGTNFLQQAVGIDAAVYYSPVVLRDAGITSTRALLGATLLMGVIKVSFVGIATCMLDHFGRRPLLLVSTAGMTVALLTQALAFLKLPTAVDVDVSSTVTATTGVPAAAIVAFTGLCFYVAFFSIGIGPINWLYTSEIFPLRLRAQAAGIGTAVNRIASGVVAMTFLSLADATGSPAGPFFMFAGMGVVGFVFFYFLAPETRGKSLEQIVRMFEKGTYAWVKEAPEEIPSVGLAVYDGNKMQQGWGETDSSPSRTPRDVCVNRAVAAMRKKVDARIRTLVENGVKSRQRSMFVIVGDKGREQVVNLHYMLSKAVVKARPNVLWCYKNDLFLSSNRKKRMRQMKKMMQRGLLDPEKEDPFALFMASTAIRYCYYAETHKILGNTFGMCVLQDFEALTPNLLARTIETVEGGGIVVLLLSSLTSLSRLFALAMDVHARYRTESHGDVVGRFNERFILSLASCPTCCVMDDELNILPLSSHMRHLQPSPLTEGEAVESESDRELKELKESLADTQPVGALVATCRTLDQAKAVVTFLDAVSEKTLRSTVAITAARGRGKSAALGVAVAGAVALGYSNIFVTAPSPENLKTLFEFVFKGFDAIGYKEHIDYELVESTNPAFNRAIVRVNVFHQHRQTIQYVMPQHAERVQQAELLVIDEAAAIPLPMVKALLGPYLVFMGSTVNGYEGTGRSLSLKLIQQLREQSKGAAAAGAGGASATADASGGGGGGGGVSVRVLREVELQEPIRYAEGDPVEKWLNHLLCLDATSHVPKLQARMPHPDECELFYVNRDTLFSFHSASELFLQRMMALYVSSHYKNTPNDLQLMSDAPAHHLFVLLGPVDETQTSLPDVLCVLQVCLEGEISRASALKGLSQGHQPTGDLLPWTLSQQFQDSEFPSLSGARVVRIAVHPDLMHAGYGSRAVDLLARYYEGQLTSMGEDSEEESEEEEQGGQRHSKAVQEARENGSGSLLEEQLAPRSGLPPLLQPVGERRQEQLHYVGVSFGLGQQLFNFWRRQAFVPLYVRQTPSDITGEHTCIMLKPLRNDDLGPADSKDSWLGSFSQDFHRRFLSLLGFSFRPLPPALCLSILDPQIEFAEAAAREAVVPAGLMEGKAALLSPYDMKRLESYANNLVDYHLIMDLIPPVARLYFLGLIPASLSYAQAAILLSFGLQHHELSTIEANLRLPGTQVLALFNKAIRKIHSVLYAAAARTIEAALPRIKEVDLRPHPQSVDEDLAEAADQAKKVIKSRLEGAAEPDTATLLTSLTPGQMQEFAIDGRDEDFVAAIAAGGGKLPGSGVLSIKAQGGGKKRGSAGDGISDGAEGGKKRMKACMRLIGLRLAAQRLPAQYIFASSNPQHALAFHAPRGQPSCATSGTAAVATSALPVPLQAKRIWLAPCADALSAPRVASARPSLSAEALAGRTRVRVEAQAGAGAAEVPPPETKLYDFVVIGSGIAGLRFALGVAAKGTVAVVTKAEPQEGSTNYAQGGVSAVLDPLDSIENHISDTIVAGAYLNDVEVVEVVCREGPERVRELMRMGASFDRGDDGRLLLAREGGHSHSRIVHAADVTGREIQRALLTAAQKTKRIDMFEHHMAIDLLTRQEDSGKSTCYGVEALDTETGQIIRFIAGSTLLATGGAGHVYPNTTNPTVATGDGVALALRAGAVISNMEFIQFHPTALADAGLPIQPPGPRPNSFLISEAVRGAGGLLYNQAGERFMLHYDPRAELAPRDVVARSIDDQLKRRGDLFVYLDISHKPTDEILRHFPNIAAECKRWGVDITKDPIPVVPAAHYMCGGVQTGLFGETSIRGLWAAGEVACTGLHGANRLASNSLLEALVFAQRAVEPAIAHAVAAAPLNHVLAGLPDGRDMDGAMWGGEEWEGEGEGEGEEVKVVGLSRGDLGAVAAAGVTAKYREQLKAIMWRYVVIVRSTDRLRIAQREIEYTLPYLSLLPLYPQAIMWRYVGIVRSTDRLRIAQREIDTLASAWRADLQTNVLLPRGAVSMETCEMENLINVASLVVRSALRRRESRGLHFTTDFPGQSESASLHTVLVAGCLDEEEDEWEEGGREREREHDSDGAGDLEARFGATERLGWTTWWRQSGPVVRQTGSGAGQARPVQRRAGGARRRQGGPLRPQAKPTMKGKTERLGSQPPPQ